jgi:hypothetical protein
MDRRAFAAGGLCTGLLTAFPGFTQQTVPQTTTPALPVPASSAEDVYTIYSQILNARLTKLKTHVPICLIADQTCVPPIPPVEEVIPANFEHRTRPIIVPSPARWYEAQEILESFRKCSKSPLLLEDHFQLTATESSPEAPPVLLLDRRMQEQFLNSFTPELLAKLPDGTFISSQHRDDALLKRLAGCNDLFRLSPVFFSNAADLALVYLIDLYWGSQEVWGVYAKSSGEWKLQGKDQGWFIVQPFATDY